MKKMELCPCHSGKKYLDCCKKYHDGCLPENALTLMRSRYSAYALHLAEYIMDTTHHENSSYSTQRMQWKKQILQFASETLFEGLKINEFIDGEKMATVTFTAYLKQGDKDATFTEKSQFVKVNGRWLYLGSVFGSP